MVSVRWAELRDIEHLQEIYANDGRKHNRDLSGFPVANWILAEDRVFLVAETPKNRYGFIIARKNGDEARIDFLSVLKKFQGKGIEQRLLKQAEKVLAGCKFLIYVPKEDKDLAKFYETQGYLVYDEIKNLFGEGEHGLVLIKKTREQKPIMRVLKPRTELSAGEESGESVLSENLKKLEELPEENSLEDKDLELEEETSEETGSR